MGNYSGLGDLIESAFRAHPIRFPLLLLVLGGGATGWLLFGAHTFGRAIGFAVVIAIVGEILLPIGVVVAIRRQRNPIILRCGRCGAESRTASRPFRIQRF